MKKNLRPLLGTAAFGTLLIAMSLNAFAGPVTEKNAKTIALDHANVKESNVSYSEVDTDREDGRLIYEVEFYTKDLIEYKYEILASDGTILNIDYDAEDAFRAGSRTGKAVTLEQAKKKAVEHAGENLDEVTFEKAGSDQEDRRTVYKICFYSDTAEYDYELDADTGFILKWEYQSSPKNTRKDSEKNTAVDLEGAKKAALKRAGLKDSEVTWGKAEADYDDGRLIYEGEFYSGGLEYEFEIDAATGAFLDWDMDD